MGVCVVRLCLLCSAIFFRYLLYLPSWKRRRCDWEWHYLSLSFFSFNLHFNELIYDKEKKTHRIWFNLAEKDFSVDVLRLSFEVNLHFCASLVKRANFNSCSLTNAGKLQKKFSAFFSKDFMSTTINFWESWKTLIDTMFYLHSLV